jgi:peptidoglycan biosynthesis protein MviN/MurJ (putative lipid II flippase)
MPVSFRDVVITGSDVWFALLVIGILTFATLSTISKSQRLSIIHFLLSGLLLSYFIMTYGNIIIGVVVALVYVSMCSLLLLLARPRGPANALPAKTLMLVVISVLAVFALACGKLAVLPPTRDAINQYTKVAGGITLLMTLLFVAVFAGVSFLIMRRHQAGYKTRE